MMIDRDGIRDEVLAAIHKHFVTDRDPNVMFSSSSFDDIADEHAVREACEDLVAENKIEAEKRSTIASPYPFYIITAITRSGRIEVEQG